MKGAKMKKTLEILGVVFSILCILLVLNAGKVQTFIYEKDRYIPLHNIFYEDREASISNSGKQVVIYDGIALLLRDIETNKEEFVITLESRGIVKDFVWSENDDYIVYLKDEFNNDFSIWLVDIKNKTNTMITSLGEYSNFSWMNSVSKENFIYAKYIVGQDKPIYYSMNLEYLSQSIINDEKKYDEIAFDKKGNQLLALKANSLGIEFYNPSNNSPIGSVYISDSPSAGYFEVIDDKVYFVMKENEKLNLYSFDGNVMKVIKEDINKDIKIEKVLLLDHEFAGIYGIKENYIWNIEKKYKDKFNFTQDKEVNYKLINSSIDGSNIIVRNTSKFDPGDIYLADLKNDEISEIINIQNSIKEELLYNTQSITIEDKDINDKSKSQITQFDLTLGDKRYTNNDLFIILDSDFSVTYMDNKYDPLVQSVVNRGINVAKLTYNYNTYDKDYMSFSKHVNKVEIDMIKIVNYLKEQKSIEKSKIHIIAKGKSALIATQILEQNEIDIKGIVLLEPILDIKSAPFVSTLEKSIINTFDDYPNLDEYIKDYDVKGLNFIVYLNTEVSDSKLTNEFYKNSRKTTDKYLYKKAGVYNEHNIGSTYLLEEYIDKFIKN